MDRIAMLQEFLDQNPADAFARYGLAMEYSKAGQAETALHEFQKILETNADYVPAYQMAAQVLAQEGRDGESREWLTRGIEAARRTGNSKAQNEMQAILQEME